MLSVAAVADERSVTSPHSHAALCNMVQMIYLCTADVPQFSMRPVRAAGHNVPLIRFLMLALYRQ